MADSPRPVSERIAFSCYRNKASVDKVVSQGLSVKPGNFNYLGKKKYYILHTCMLFFCTYCQLRHAFLG